LRYLARVLSLLTLVFSLWTGVNVLAQSADQAAAKQTDPSTPPYHKSAQDAKPLPALLPASQFSDRPLVAKAYEIAHQIPLVLAQQPCYCHCDKAFGHTSLLDCFTSTHTAGCGICIGETFFAAQMTSQGKTPAEIREAIIRGDWKRPIADKGSK
jgi:Protein of unknown function with PCYCGC motif